MIERCEDIIEIEGLGCIFFKTRGNLRFEIQPILKLSSVNGTLGYSIYHFKVTTLMNLFWHEKEKEKYFSWLCSCQSVFEVLGGKRQCSNLKDEPCMFYYEFILIPEQWSERNMLHCKEKVDSQTLPELQLNKFFSFFFSRWDTSLNLYNETCLKRLTLIH